MIDVVKNKFLEARMCQGGGGGIFFQGSYGSWKTWKVLEFHYGIFQDWKVLESSGNLLNAAKKWKAVRKIYFEILGVKGLL